MLFPTIPTAVLLDVGRCWVPSEIFRSCLEPYPIFIEALQMKNLDQEPVDDMNMELTPWGWAVAILCHISLRLL